MFKSIINWYRIWLYKCIENISELGSLVLYIKKFLLKYYECLLN